MKRIFLLINTLLLLSICTISCDQKVADVELRFWDETWTVASETAISEWPDGVERETFWIKKKGQSEWEHCYYEIKNFDYNKGFEYVIIVRATAEHNPPLEGDNLEYALKRQVSKTKKNSDIPNANPGPGPGPDDDPVVSPEGKFCWAEYPEVLKQNDNYKYLTHYGHTYRTKQYVRNYSACYDVVRHNPVWVAYPCHDIYWEGGYTRPTRDPWRPDPMLQESEQSIIYATDWDNWPWSDNKGRPTDVYYYWSPMPSGKTVTKGHLMRSAERGAGTANVLLDLNEQTFYPTNIAPEAYLNCTENSSHWGDIEGILPNSWKCKDTIFVISGCYYEHNDWQIYDASNWGNTSSKSKVCVMPTARYKLVMRTKTGNTGKPIWKCKASEVMAIGFWFPQNFTGEVLEPSQMPPLADYIYSVSDIEKMIGGEFSFFPTAPEGVKDSYNIADWPGLSAISGK